MKAFCLIFFLAWSACVMANPGDTTKRSSRSQLVNPFRNIKSSLYFQYGGGPLLGRGYGGGVELRRFTSITTYIFLDLEWHDWRIERGLDNYFYMEGKYLLTSQSAGAKFGFARQFIGGYVGAKYITKAYLREEVVSNLNTDTHDYFEGDITPYTQPLIPLVGVNAKLKLLSVLFFEAGMELWLRDKRVFKDLETEWKAPPKVSPFLSRKVDSGYFYASIHVKL